MNTHTKVVIASYALIGAAATTSFLLGKSMDRKNRQFAKKHAENMARLRSGVCTIYSQ